MAALPTHLTTLPTGQGNGANIGSKATDGLKKTAAGTKQGPQDDSQLQHLEGTSKTDGNPCPTMLLLNSRNHKVISLLPGALDPALSLRALM